MPFGSERREERKISRGKMRQRTEEVREGERTGGWFHSGRGKNSYWTKEEKEIDCALSLKLLIWSRGPTTREELLYEIIGMV